ncbi:methyltransferase [Nocardioides panacihumi]|uniref:Methyltransferase n=1 Tax=Nocardioides panacihumi TaxID=400774 RepID=A0ABP5CAD9_9ACTN
MTDPFEERLAEWKAWAEAPWGRIRFAVVGETLRRQTDWLGRRLRVLDVGGGDGRDAVPLAVAGHDVTVLDPAPGWLAEARSRAAEAGVELTTLEGGLDDLPVTGTFDLVLCHFVLHYRPAGTADLARLAALVRPGGRLSVMAPNPAAMVLMRLTRSGPEAALRELVAEAQHSVTFDHTARKITAEEMASDLEQVGLAVVDRYGTRIANDLLTDDEAKRDPAYFDRLLELELALCDREPFLRVGGMWQLVAERRTDAGTAPPRW